MPTSMMLSRQQLEKIKENYMKYKVPVRFTFTNCLVQGQHLNDAYCNMILKTFATGNNDIICNSPLLEEKIRNEYGNIYKYISSTTKRLNNADSQMKELEKNYDIIVLDYDFNKNFTFLEQIKNKEKCELLCNAVCKPNCPLRKLHYERMSLFQLEGRDEIEMKCPDSNKRFWEVKDKNPTFISREDINNIYSPMGFQHFKLEGRTAAPYDLIEILAYYLIKPQYEIEVRERLISL